MRHVADAESDRIGVETLVRKGQVLRIPFDEIDVAVEPLAGSPPGADREHRAVDVENGDMRSPVGSLDDPEGNVAGSAGDVERAPVRSPRRVQRRHHRILPDTVQAARHDVVHQVVAARDAVEDGVDALLLLPLADRLVTVGGFHSAVGRYALSGHWQPFTAVAQADHGDMTESALSSRHLEQRGRKCKAAGRMPGTMSDAGEEPSAHA